MVQITILDCDDITPKTRVETDKWRDHFSASWFFLLVKSCMCTLSLCCDSAKQSINDTLMYPFGSFCDFEFVTMIHLSLWFFRHAWVYFYSCMLDPMWNVQDLFTYLSCFRARLFPVFLFCSVVCACSLHKTSCASWVMIMMIIITSEDLMTVLSLF